MQLALETVEHVRTKYGQDVTHDQKSIIGLLLSIIGWDANRAISKDEFNLWKDRVVFSEYILKSTNMLSEYVFNRISEFDKEKKTNEEISDCLRRMAKINCGTT